MKKKMVGLAAAILLLSWSNTNASQCTYEEQAKYNKDAANIKVTKIEGSEDIPNDEGTLEVDNNYTTFYFFKISFYNITENTYIKLSNTANNEIKIITYDDTDNGTYQLEWKDLSQVTTFNYEIMTSTNTACPNEKLLSGVLTIPKFNFYYDFPICEEVPTSYLCNKYISIDIDEAEFERLINKEIKKEKIKEIEEEEKEEEKNNSGIIIGAVIFSIILIGLVILLVRKGVKKNEKK